MSLLQLVSVREASPSMIFLVGANLVPLFGVLVLGWSLFAVVFLYWAENVVIGVFNAIRMGQAAGPPPKEQATLNGRSYTRGARAALIAFFGVHYGIFTIVHGAFIVALFGPFDLDMRSFLAAVLMLVLSHGISYRKNFIEGGEFRRAHETTLFMQPYRRVILLHVTILFGAVLVVLLGAPLGALALFVVLKTLVDLYAHKRERERFGRVRTHRSP